MRLSPAHSLAAAAVGALAVTGLAVTAPTAQAVDPGVVLLSQYNDGADASLRFDGRDSLIALAAEVTDPTASVTFEYNLDPDATDTSPRWTAIAGTPVVTGSYATLDWDAAGPRGTTLTGRTVAVRAVATVDDGGVPVSTYSTRNGVHIARDSSDTPSVTLRPAVFSGGRNEAGFFVQPYVESGMTSTLTRLTGTTSATSGTVALSWRDEGGAFGGTVDADVVPTPLKVPDTYSYVEGGRFSGVLDISDAEPQNGEVIAFGADLDTDEVWAADIYEQTISDVNAQVTSNPRAGEDADVRVTVADVEDYRPMVGVEIRRSSDDTLVGYTDEDGGVETTQPAGTVESYYANVTDDDPYVAEDGDRVSPPVDATGYDPEPTYVDANLSDGDAFDRDEYADGDIYLQVRDQAGRPVGAGESASYRLYHSESEAPATLVTGTTDDDGRVPVAFEPGPSGEYLLDYRLGSNTDPEPDPEAGPEARDTSLTTASFVTGDAELTFRPRSPAVADAGGQIDYVGSMTVEGVPLAGRRIGLRYTRGVEVVPGRFPDAGMVTDSGIALRRTVTTDRSGLFDVTVDDKLESTSASEVGGVLRARTLDNVASEASPLDGNALADGASRTQFGDGSRGSVRVRLYGAGRGPRADQLRVGAPASVAGETVKVFRYQGGRLVLERTVVLDSEGDAPYIGIRDRNGTATTTYVVRLQSSKRVVGSYSNRRELS